MKRLLIITSILIYTVISMNAQEWNTSLEFAKTKAADENKKVIMVFQGSDWCGPCIRLDREIWSNEDFKTYAKDHFVMLKVDFPRSKKNALSKEQKKHNSQLADKYNSEGHFPLIIVLDEKGTILGKTGYKNISPAEFASTLDSL